MMGSRAERAAMRRGLARSHALRQPLQGTSDAAWTAAMTKFLDESAAPCDDATVRRVLVE